MNTTIVELPTINLHISTVAADAEDSNWIENAAELAKIAAFYYNRSIENLKKQDIRESLENIDQCIEIMPYVLEYVEYALLLHLKHGQLKKAYLLSLHLKKLGEIEKSEQYIEEIKRITKEWNDFLENPEELLKQVVSNKRDFSLRELEFLVHSFQESLPLSVKNEAVRHNLIKSFPTVVKRKSKSSIVVIAILAIVAIASNLYWVLQKNQAVDSSLIVKTDSTAKANFFSFYSSFLNNNELSLIQKLEHLNRIIQTGMYDTVGVHTLQGLLAEKIYEKSVEFWKNQDYEHLYAYLKPIEMIEVQSNALKLYRLGISAIQKGDSETALRSLKVAYDSGMLPAYCYPEVIYQLALLTSPPHNYAFAKVIREKYSNTIYYNSKIRRLLNEL